MSLENKPQIVSDTGCFIQRETSVATELGINYAPLDITFFENGNPVSFQDSDLTPEEFYKKMSQSSELPKTSGAIPDKLFNIYDSQVKNDRSILSVHLTSKHSAVYNSAIMAKRRIENEYPNIFKTKKPHLFIEVIDTRQISVAGGFLAEQAAHLANEGYPFKDITRIILETIPKIEVFTTLNNFENVVKGGRLSSRIGAVGDGLHIKPFIAVVDGELKLDILKSKNRTEKQRQKRLFDKIENTKEEIIRLAIIHTNFLEGAQELKQSLSQIYSGEIEIYEAGPVLGVHAGEKGLGIALQKA